MLLILALPVNIAYAGLSACKHVQFSEQDIRLPDRCIAQSINGVVDSTIITCNDNGFTETSYNGDSCQGKHSNEITYGYENLYHSNSYNCANDAVDCAAVYRLYNNCPPTTDFSDEIFFKGYEYIYNKDTAQEYCRMYECSNHEVNETDCGNNDTLLFTYSDSECGANNKYYSILHCGDQSAAFVTPDLWWGLPDVPTKSPT
eukprot:185413_1